MDTKGGPPGEVVSTDRFTWAAAAETSRDAAAATPVNEKNLDMLTSPRLSFTGPCAFAALLRA
jgi:hypothetical protein